MTRDFVAEILRATGALRAGDPSAATDIIKAALAAGGLSSSGVPPMTKRNGSSTPLLAKGLTIEGTPASHATSARQANVVRPAALHGARMRRPLGEVLRTLTEGRQGLGLDGKPPSLRMPSRRPEPVLPEGAEFRDLRHACPAGARRYRLYIPASVGDAPQGLIVMLHGCKQNAEDFAHGTRMNAHAEEHRLLVAYPDQTNGDNAMSCWNWFRPGDQMRDMGEPAIIADLTTSIRDEFVTPHDRVFVAGLSAGGAMAAIMGETYPELYAGVGIHSGLAYGAANDVLSAFSAMRGQTGFTPHRTARPSARPRVIVFHGGADTTVHPSNADHIIASLGHDETVRSEHPASDGLRSYSKLTNAGDGGVGALECWIIDGAQHAWSGGDATGSYTDPQGPDASAAMVQFFLYGADGGRDHRPMRGDAPDQAGAWRDESGPDTRR